MVGIGPIDKYVSDPELLRSDEYFLALSIREDHAESASNKPLGDTLVGLGLCLSFKDYVESPPDYFDERGRRMESFAAPRRSYGNADACDLVGPLSADRVISAAQDAWAERYGDKHQGDFTFWDDTAQTAATNQYNTIQLNLVTKRAQGLRAKPNRGPRVQLILDFSEGVIDFIEAWFARAGLDFPEIELVSAHRSKSDQFVDLIKEALEVGQQTGEQLWDWKERFGEFPKSYFRRYQKRRAPFKQGAGSANGLEWRTNSKFRKPRS